MLYNRYISRALAAGRQGMTLRALQEYLDVVKWKDSEKIRADMCGRYARCRYCMRTEDYPCARAHNRLAEMQASPVPDRIPEWLLPEPPVKEKFGAEIASEEEPRELPAKSAGKATTEPRAAKPVSDAAETQTSADAAPAPAEELPAAQPETAESETELTEAVRETAQPEEPRLLDRPRPHVIMRGVKGETRVCVLRRKPAADAAAEQSEHNSVG